MSLKNSIANCRKSFAFGSYREVFYSQKYDVVIKKSYADTECGNEQTLRELEIYKRLTKREKEFFPIVDFITDGKNQPVVIMKKVDCTIKQAMYQNSLKDRCYEGSLHSGNCLEELGLRTELEILKRTFNLVFDTEVFEKIILKYNLTDLHPANLGILDNKLVFIDFGWRWIPF